MREYTATATAIWRDLDFRVLVGAEQRLYWLLKSQAEISACGVLPMTIDRWADLAADTTPASIVAALDGLARHRFVVVDVKTQEVLVRTFTKHDKGYCNPKRKPVILRAAAEVYSPTIRAALAVEFAKLGLPTAGLVPSPPASPPDRPPGRPSDRYPDTVSGPWLSTASSTGLSTGSSTGTPGTDTWDAPTKQLPLVQVNTVSGSPSDTDPDRLSGTTSANHGVEVSKALVVVGLPLTSTPTPVAGPAPAPRAAVDDDELTEEEGEEPNDDRGNPTPETDLVRRIREIRPEWSARSITRGLRDEDVADRPWPVIEHAALAIARDRRTQVFGRLRGDGPWWANAAAATGTRPTPDTDLAPARTHDFNPDPDDPATCAHCHAIETNRHHTRRGADVIHLHGAAS